MARHARKVVVAILLASIAAHFCEARHVSASDLLAATSQFDAEPGASTSDAPTAASDAMALRIDRLLQSAWSDADITAAPLASDSEFLRRAYLDLTGVIPTAGEVRRFLADRRPDKRVRLIDQLLQHPLHATHLANQWRRGMLPDQQNVNVLAFQGAGLQRWLRDGFADNVPYDRLVYDLLAAEADDNLAGAAQFYTALGMQPEKVATNVSRMFLGMQ